MDKATQCINTFTEKQLAFIRMKKKAFKSTPLNEWTISKWFFHIKNIVKLGLNVELSIGENVEWKNIIIISQVQMKRN